MFFDIKFKEFGHFNIYCQLYHWNMKTIQSNLCIAQKVNDWQPILNSHDLWALRPSFKNRHNSVVDNYCMGSGALLKPLWDQVHHCKCHKCQSNPQHVQESKQDPLTSPTSLGQRTFTTDKGKVKNSSALLNLSKSSWLKKRETTLHLWWKRVNDNFDHLLLMWWVI